VAQAADDVFAGRTINVIAGFPPAAASTARCGCLRASSRSTFPGQPGIVPRNMQGAGGIILANHLYTWRLLMASRSACPDAAASCSATWCRRRGSTTTSRGSPTLAELAAPPTRYGFTGATGISSVADLKRARTRSLVGALNARSENAIAPRVLESYEGWPLKIVTGYPGFSEVLIALDRGEVDALFTHEGSIANSRPDLISSGAVKPIVQSFDAMAGVPVLADVVVDANARALLGLVTTPTISVCPLLGPPGIPSERSRSCAGPTST